MHRLLKTVAAAYVLAVPAVLGYFASAGVSSRRLAQVATR
jgi:hypothetical protein